MSDVTRILSRIEQGDPAAAQQLLPLVYDELRKLAAVKLAQEKPGQTLQATALVHEAYLRLVDVPQVQHWNTVRRHSCASYAYNTQTGHEPFHFCARLPVLNAFRHGSLEQVVDFALGHYHTAGISLFRGVREWTMTRKKKRKHEVTAELSNVNLVKAKSALKLRIYA